MADTSDLELWAATYQVLGRGFYRIKPEPDMDETCSFMTCYLLRCVHENVSSDALPSGFEAASDLAACLKHWASKLPETQPVLFEAAQKITNAYLRADDRERDRLLHGTLEHALVTAAVRPYFQRWSRDPVLGEPWQLAMKWAVAHGDPAGS
jgi:hypothetical protein